MGGRIAEEEHNSAAFVPETDRKRWDARASAANSMGSYGRRDALHPSPRERPGLRRTYRVGSGSIADAGGGSPVATSGDGSWNWKFGNCCGSS